MPYIAKGKCVYRKDTGAKVGCTNGDIKKYLAALYANTDESVENENLEEVRKKVFNILSEIFIDKGFEYKKTEESNHDNYSFFRYEFQVKEYLYKIILDITKNKSGNVASLDFATSSPGDMFNINGDINLDRIDTIRVLKTLGEILTSHKDEIDFLEVRSKQKRIKNYKGIISAIGWLKLEKSFPEALLFKKIK